MKRWFRLVVASSSILSALGCGTATCPAGSTSAECVTVCTTPVALAPTDVRNGKTLPAGSCWSASGALFVLDGVLDIGAGVNIAFAPGSSLRAQGAGRIRAVGTAEAPVVLRGAEEGRGVWRGVGFDSRSNDNRLEHVQVVGAGEGAWTGDEFTIGAVFVGREGGVALVNVLVSESGSNGLYLHGAESRVAPLSGLQIRDGQFAARVHPQAALQLTGDTVFEGNDDNLVRMGIGGTDFVTKSGTWRKLSVPWALRGKIYLRADVTVEAGSILYFGTAARLVAEARDGNVGSLSAVGTAESPILFTSAEGGPGAWMGLGFDTGSTKNKLAHASVVFAGAEAWTGNPLSKAAVFVGETGRLSLDTVSISSSEARGIHLYGNQSVVSCAGVTFQDNQGANVGRGDSSLDACP